ncbi:uncharacterized protein UBRO_20714 [Ustilago bromivora]|uniref:Tc1-like transposase DDE domain-containing protein n=1 Tax=Ustilago bromivora TaxID=307758 RepID=A0A1K0G511_9BASI|nr:uncharacterized protein UBRO_20714 [Ustilago bromivora]
MVHGNELPPMQHASIIAMHDTGLPIRRIMELSGVSKTAVHKTIHNFKERGSFETKARSGCLRSWTATSDCYLQREVLKNPFLSWRQLSASLGGIPIMQLRKAAYRAGINRRIALRKPFLTAKTRHKCLEWAKANGSTDWRGVLFMDEAAVEVGYRPGCTWVSRRKNTREDINNMVPTFCSGRFSIQVWTGIAYNLKTPLVVLPLAPRKKRPGSANQWDPTENLTAVRYCSWIINGPLRDAVTAVSVYPDGLLVVKDGSSCHQAAICKQQRAEYNIKTQEHPPASPDLNPIENIWYVFKNLLGKRLPVLKTQDELTRAAEEVWNTQITLEHIDPVIDSMEHHVEQVLTKQGGPLKY